MSSSQGNRDVALRLVTKLVCWARRLKLNGLEHFPRQGPALIVANHNSPMDFFYALALMGRLRREDFRLVVAAELLDRQQFRPYVQAAIEAEVEWMAPYARPLAGFLTAIVPPVFLRLHPIPVFRKGDDSESRNQSLECLLRGELVVIAPGTGNRNHRNASGMRPLTYGVASIARRYFEATRQALAVFPLAIQASGRGVLSKVTLRAGEPFRGMCEEQYPELFPRAGEILEAAKHQAYQRYTQQLAERLMELLQPLSGSGSFPAQA
jgi:1-acyl-sn-glycerol-3-phosphate acyltransferase